MGGIQASAAKIINGLPQDVSDILLTKPILRQKLRPGVETHFLAAAWGRKLPVFLELALAAFAVARLIRRRQLETLLTFGFSMHVVGQLASLLAPNRCKVIHCVRNSLNELDENRKRKWMSVLSRWSLRKADIIIVNSTALKAEAVSIGASPAKVHVIHNGYDLEKLTALSQAVVGHNGICPRFVFVGRLSQQKNLELLLRGFADLLVTHEASLSIVGSGESLPEVKALINELQLDKHVQLEGEQFNPYPYMRSAVALVLTSVYEGFPNVLVEAMACGTPVISVDCPHGPREILALGGGILVPDPSPEALSQAMRTLLEMPTLHSRLSRETQGVARTYALDRMLNGFHEVINPGRAT